LCIIVWLLVGPKKSFTLAAEAGAASGIMPMAATAATISPLVKVLVCIGNLRLSGKDPVLITNVPCGPIVPRAIVHRPAVETVNPNRG
jgi:hypothetical protein